MTGRKRIVSALAATIEPMLMPGQVADLLGVDPKTVIHWATEGRLPFIRTLGGHRRYRESDVLAILAGQVDPPAEDTGQALIGWLVGVPLAALIAVALAGHVHPNGLTFLGVLAGLVLMGVGFGRIPDETPTDACDARCDLEVGHR
jgi:excisionase family DNA binding protein